MGVLDPLLSRSSSHAVGKRCAAQTRPQTDEMPPYLIITAVWRLWIISGSLRVRRRCCSHHTLRSDCFLCVHTSGMARLVGSVLKRAADRSFLVDYMCVFLVGGAADA